MASSDSQFLLYSGDTELFVRLDEAQEEQPADSTYRPDRPPVAESGARFEPLRVPDREPQILHQAPTPLSLFKQFMSESLIDSWVKYTNDGPRRGPAGPPKENARINSWEPTTRSEVYLWLACMIYISIHAENSLQDYWKAYSEVTNRPIHPITQYITFDRFHLLHRQLRISAQEDPALPRPFCIASEWSNQLKQASLRLYKPGSNIAVDECIIRFTGRSKQKVTIPNKPTPTGFKVWVIAEAGFFLGWLWHSPKDSFDYLEGQEPAAQKEQRSLAAESIRINPTQAVVISLVKTLPNSTYHVFLDNLFSSPSLFLALRKQNIGATGTARINCGFYQGFVTAKKDDTKGHNLWPHNKIEAVPTPDNQVYRHLTY